MSLTTPPEQPGPEGSPESPASSGPSTSPEAPVVSGIPVASGTPVVPEPPVASGAPVAAGTPSSSPRAAQAVTLPVLLGVAAAVVVLVFGASFLGASLARGGDSDVPAAAVTDTPATDSSSEASDSADAADDPAEDATDDTVDEEYLAEVLPAGSAIRAGKGAPDEGAGTDGDLYLDIASANIYLHRDGA